MKDQVFTGADIAQAVTRAAEALGVAVENVRYVVLERGSQGGLGLAGTPARIAVLLGSAAGPAEGPVAEPAAPAGAGDVGDAVARVVRELVRAGDLAVEIGVDETGTDITLRLSGPDTGFFVQDGAEVLQALEWVLGRVSDQAGERRRVRVRVAGQADPRETALRAQALALASAARKTGQAQQSAPLNAYERRLIHVALADEVGLKTFSVGEGADRRVTVAPVDEAAQRAEG